MFWSSISLKACLYYRNDSFLRFWENENDFVLGEIAETPQAAEIAIAEPIAQVDKFSVEYALHQLQEKMQKAQNQCLTSFEIYQRFMLDNNGFTEVLEDRLYNALNKYKSDMLSVKLLNEISSSNEFKEIKYISIKNFI